MSYGGYEGLTFSQDITYRIRVVPEPGTLACGVVGIALLSAGAWGRRRSERLRSEG